VRIGLPALWLLIGCSTATPAPCVPSAADGSAAPAEPEVSAGRAHLLWDGSGNMRAFYAAGAPGDLLLQKLEASSLPAVGIERFEHFVVGLSVQPAPSLGPGFVPSAGWTNLAAAGETIGTILSDPESRSNVVVLVTDLLVAPPPAIGPEICGVSVTKASHPQSLLASCIRHGTVPGAARPYADAIRIAWAERGMFAVVISPDYDTGNRVSKEITSLLGPYTPAVQPLSRPGPGPWQIAECTDSTGANVLMSPRNRQGARACRLRRTDLRKGASLNCALAADAAGGPWPPWQFAPRSLVVQDGERDGGAASIRSAVEESTATLASPASSGSGSGSGSGSDSSSAHPDPRLHARMTLPPWENGARSYHLALEVEAKPTATAREALMEFAADERTRDALLQLVDVWSRMPSEAGPGWIVKYDN
jgi:hypothetical protein